MSIVDQEIYKKKYIKYKTKYIKLKEQQGSALLSCPKWRYFFCFDTFEIDETLKYTEFKKKANYQSFLLADDKISFSKIDSIIGGIREKDPLIQHVRSNYTGITDSKGILYTKSDKKKHIKIPANIIQYINNIYLIGEQKLLNRINQLILESSIINKDKTEGTFPKIKKIYSFFGEDMQYKYNVKYNDGYDVTKNTINLIEITIDSNSINNHLLGPLIDKEKSK